MYNTIEVMILNISNAKIKYFKKSGFYSLYNENVRHVKVLPYLSVVQAVEGSYDFAIGSTELEQTGEGGFFIAPTELQQTIVHHVNSQSGKMSARWIFVDVEINNVHKIESLYKFPTVVSDERKAELNAIFDRLFETDDIWENYGDCYKLIGLLLKMATPIKRDTHSGIQNAVAYISEHYAEQITVKDIADISNMSESNLYAAFKKHLGVSPIAYLNRYRMSIAVDKLIETTRSVSEIGYSVGISDALYFSKLFKRTYGISPKEYRRIYGERR